MAPQRLHEQVRALPLRTAVRAQLAAEETLERLAARLHPATQDSERGAQTAEYAMVGGVGAVVCISAAAYFRLQGNDLVGRLVSAALSPFFRGIGR